VTARPDDEYSVDTTGYARENGPAFGAQPGLSG
jgi:hypothetical protein